MAELILYAVPTGRLREQLDGYFEGLETEAQRYPPHCTLTGFFHDDDRSRYVDAAASVVESVAIGVRGPREGDDRWIGFDVDAPGLRALTRRFASAVATRGSRTDPMRVKDWLHVSLAYGHAPHEHAALLARASSIDARACAAWELRLYERRTGDEWVELGAWPLSPR